MNILHGDFGHQNQDNPIISAFITNLGKYNEGDLIGKWVGFPTDYDTVQQALKDIGIDGLRYEEFFITDYEMEISGLHELLGEYENLDELNYLATCIDEIDDNALPIYESALMHESPNDIKDAINLAYNLENYYFQPDIRTEQELGEWLVEDGFVNVPNDFRYIDYEAIGRDWVIENGGSFLKGGGYIEKIDDSGSEMYDGKEVPEEYRVMSKPIELDISPDKPLRKPTHER